MVTKEQIFSDFTAAFKNRDETKKRTLSSMKSEILVFEKAKAGNEATPEALTGILKSMAKKRREAIEAYTQGGRPELAVKEQEELAIIESYLPAQLSPVEVQTLVEKIVADNDFTASDFGRAMGVVMKELAGRASGDIVNSILKNILVK